MKFLPVIFSVLLFVGCEEKFRGSLELNNSISFVNGMTKKELSKLAKCKASNSTKSRCNRLYKLKEKSTTKIQPGLHASSVVVSKKKVSINIYNQKGKKLQTIEIPIPKKTKLPEFDGEVALNSSQTGFIYDLFGDLKTDISYSDTTATSESCSWTESYEVCRGEVVAYKCGEKTCHKKVRKCKTEYETHYGSQEVEYYYKYTQKDLEIVMEKPSTKVVTGNFSGQFNDSDKIYTYKGQCY